VAKSGRPEPKTTGHTLRDCVRAPAHACEYIARKRTPERHRPRHRSGHSRTLAQAGSPSPRVDPTVAQLVEPANHFESARRGWTTRGYYAVCRVTREASDGHVWTPPADITLTRGPKECRQGTCEAVIPMRAVRRVENSEQCRKPDLRGQPLEMIGFPRWRRVQGSLAAREDEERDRHELANGGGEREHVEELVVAEDMW
jgi:hypothetical protein